MERFLPTAYCLFWWCANKQVATFIKLVSREFPFGIQKKNTPEKCLRLIQKKNRQEKCSFIGKSSWTELAVRWSVKHFFAPNSPLFPKSSGEMKKKKGNYDAFCFQSKRKKAPDVTVMNPILDAYFLPWRSPYSYITHMVHGLFFWVPLSSTCCSTALVNSFISRAIISQKPWCRN